MIIIVDSHQQTNNWGINEIPLERYNNYYSSFSASIYIDLSLVLDGLDFKIEVRKSAEDDSWSQIVEKSWHERLW